MCLATSFVAIDSSHRAGAESGRAVTADSPKKVCNAMIEAAKKEDFKSIQLWTLRPNLLSSHLHQMAGTAAQGPASAAKPSGSPQAADRGHVLSKAAYDLIKELSCGSEHIAGNRAVVEAEAKGQKRLIPFAQKDGKWLFDVRTYQSFYRDEMRQLKSSG